VKEARFRAGFYLIALLVIGMSLHPNVVNAEDGVLPPPQLVTNAWMLIVGYEADPEAIKAVLPDGLEPNPNNRVVLNMYTVPEADQTSGFGAYTLTYITVEVAGQDSYTMGQPTGFPGRYFAYYFNSSPVMRTFTKAAGIPAEVGFTTTTVKDGKLTANLQVDGTAFIESTADVGSDFVGVLGGHLNYFGLLEAQGMQQVVKYPIPWIGYPVKTENAAVNFTMPEDHPLYKLKPKKVDWAVWIRGSFVYPQYQVIHENKTEKK
jgi:acetoacetate decarboxylase